MSLGELISVEPFDLPTQFEQKYEIIRGNTVIAIVYDKPTFTIDAWYYGLPHRVGKPRRFDTSDFFELMRRNPMLNNYRLGPTGRAEHVLVVILEREGPEAFIVPRSTYEMLSTMPADQMVTEIRRLSSDQAKSSGRSEEVKLSKKFMLFVAYDNDLGFDFAEHLKGTLEKRGISTFVAKMDVPPFIKRNEKWRQSIDHVIGTCNTFILILSTDKLTEEVARESRLAFARNRTESEFSILICHLQGRPRTDQQLLAVGIDSKEYQQKDFTTTYDLARIVTSSLDNEGFPKTPESVHEEQSPRVILAIEEPRVGCKSGDAPTSWHLKFTFSNRGDRIARVSNSSIRLLLEGPVDNIVPECHGFGPENRNDFFVKPGDPITGTTTVRINPKVAALNWHTKYEAAYKAGKMKIVIVVRYDDSDEVLSSRESHEKTIPVVIPV